jgi:hypothetical protein
MEEVLSSTYGLTLPLPLHPHPYICPAPTLLLLKRHYRAASELRKHFRISGDKIPVYLIVQTTTKGSPQYLVLPPASLITPSLSKLHHRVISLFDNSRLPRFRNRYAFTQVRLANKHRRTPLDRAFKWVSVANPPAPIWSLGMLPARLPPVLFLRSYWQKNISSSSTQLSTTSLPSTS